MANQTNQTTTDDMDDDEIILDTAAEQAAPIALPPEDDDFDADAPLTEDERALLSEEELAILDGAEGDAAQTETADTDPAPGAATETAPAVAPAATAQELPPRPEVDAEAARAKVENADAAREAAFTAYEDGETTRDEYLAQMKRIDQEVAESRADLALIARHEQAEEAAFTARVESFKADATAYLKEFAFLTDEAHITAFDRHVRAVTAAHSERMGNRAMLEMAHKLYATEAEALGQALPAVPAARTTTQKATTTTPEPGKPKLAPKPQAPVTLRTIPAAAISETAQTRYAAIQARLDAVDGDPWAAERIMLSLSPEEREAFASMDL